MPFVSVLFPLPSSPESSTSTGAFSVSANARPQATVSSAECVIASSATRLQLLQQFPPCHGHRARHFPRQHALFVALRAHQLCRASVQISSHPHHPVHIPLAKPRNPRRHQSPPHRTPSS